MHRVLIGIVAHNRPECTIKLLESLDTPYPAILINSSNDNIPEYDNVINKSYLGRPLYQSTKGTSVVFNKNVILLEFLKTRADYLFIIENDIRIKNNNVFNKYIEASKKYSIPHMNFTTICDKEFVYNWNDNIIVHEKCQGAFQFFTKKAVERSGLMDEDFDSNSVEHVEYTNRVQRNMNYDPWCWHYLDLINSGDYLEYQKVESSISNTPEITQKYRDLMWKKIGYQPALIKKTLKIL